MTLFQQRKHCSASSPCVAALGAIKGSLVGSSLPAFSRLG